MADAHLELGKVGPNGEPVCMRQRCRRTKDLNKNNLCGGHACPVPFCTFSKSSTEALCEKHLGMRAQPLPKNWLVVDLSQGVPVYLNMKDLVAQYDHPGPGGEKKLPRTSRRKAEKPKKGHPTLFDMQPQPTDLPADWEQILAFSGLDEADMDNIPAPSLLYYNFAQGNLQASDPRPPPEDADPLPSGWRKGFDVDGDVFYIDDNSDIMTYDDPRLVDHPTASQALRLQLRKGLSRKRTASRKSKTVWKMPTMDMAGFTALDNVLSYPNDIPECVRNKTYNRYMDIIPNPASAVHLPRVGADPTSEYINANFIRSCDDEPRTYIAAQGPLPATVDHFWRMIWENKVTIIVMVTGLVEKGATKCERYWPTDGGRPLEYDCIKVTNAGSKTYRGYVLTQLKVQREKETLNINHFWFTTWPDHGVPRTPTGLIFTDDVIELLQHVNSLSKKRTAPTLVHCSAGIGRTGTFIAIDQAMALLQLNHTVDPLAVISSIRRDRCALVQHDNQYEFMYEACLRFAELSKCMVLVEGEERVATEASVEDLSTLRAREKSEATARVRTAASRGGRSRLLSQSQVSGELRLRATFKGEEVSFVDVDGDGKMDWREAQLMGMSREAFDELDLNKDGVVTLAEFKEYQKRSAARRA